MKTNEAPEKIHISKDLFRWSFNGPQSKSDIEYTRTDAFIEKAVGFIRENIESDKYKTPDEESYRMGYRYDYFETNMFIEDFKNYMKGE